MEKLTLTERGNMQSQTNEIALITLKSKPVKPDRPIVKRITIETFSYFLTTKELEEYINLNRPVRNYKGGEWVFAEIGHGDEGFDFIYEQHPTDDDFDNYQKLLDQYHRDMKKWEEERPIRQRVAKEQEHERMLRTKRGTIEELERKLAIEKLSILHLEKDSFEKGVFAKEVK